MPWCVADTPAAIVCTLDGIVSCQIASAAYVALRQLPGCILQGAAAHAVQHNCEDIYGVPVCHAGRDSGWRAVLSHHRGAAVGGASQGGRPTSRVA